MEGVKRVTHAAVGEKHSLALQSWCATPLALRMRSASSGALSSALSGHMDRAASAAESVGLAGPWEEEEGLREQRSSALEDAEKSAYWRSLEALQGPSSRYARLFGGVAGPTCPHLPASFLDGSSAHVQQLPDIRPSDPTPINCLCFVAAGLLETTTRILSGRVCNGGGK